MHILYGASFEVQRQDCLDYYPCAKMLGIDNLISLLHADILQNIEYYDLFKVFDLSIKYNEE